jgi:hypothetical protein
MTCTAVNHVLAKMTVRPRPEDLRLRRSRAVPVARRVTRESDGLLTGTWPGAGPWMPVGLPRVRLYPVSKA